MPFMNSAYQKRKVALYVVGSYTIDVFKRDLTKGKLTMSKASNIKATTTADTVAKRLAAIAKLCATLGTQYQGLRQYRGL
jgi:hypothetical protein